MEHKYTGRCASTTKRTSKLALCGLLAACTAGLQAAPVDYHGDDLADALETAQGAWAESLIRLEDPTQEREGGIYDEQIFTELSPILDSPEAIRLPEDQLLSE